MTRALRPASLLLLGGLLLIGCGGVARNPSEPNFPNQGTRQNGNNNNAAGGANGQGQNLSPDQDPNLQGAVTPEDFRDRAQVALIGGNLVTGVNGYTKMVELKQDDPEAALALAVTTLWRDVDHFTYFTADQLPLTFYNTPLTLVPTLVPQPLAQDDGYLWRLLALGIDAQPGLDPGKLLADFLAEAGAKSPAGMRPQPTQIDPEVAGRLEAGSADAAGQPAGDEANDAANENAKREQEDQEREQIEREREDRGREGAGTDPYGARGAQALVDDTRSGQQARGDGAQSDELGKIEEKRDARRGDTGTDTKTGGTNTGGAANLSGGANTGGSANPTAILTQTQYVEFTADRVGTDLLPKLKTYLDQRSALSFTWEGRSAKLNQFRQTIDGLLAALDRTEGKVKDEFHLEIPILLGTKVAPEVHKIAFEKPDFEMVRQQLKLMKWLLDYRSQYTTAGQWNFLVPPKDVDTDGVLSPAEYYPAAPFGTLTEGSKQGLKGMQGQLGEILSDMGEAMQDYRDAEIYTSSAKNYLLPRSLDPSLDTRVLLSEFDRMLDVSLALPKDGAEVQVAYLRGSDKINVTYAPLFDGTLDDVRKLLPAFDPASRAIMPSEGRPESLLPGVLPAGTPFENWMNRSLTISGLIIKNSVPLANVDVTAGPNTTKTAEVTGMFSLQNVALNPLVGLELTISGSGVTDPVIILARSSSIAWDVSLPIQHAAGAAGVAEPGEGAVATSPGGETIMTPEGDAEGGTQSGTGLIGGLRGRAGNVGGKDDTGGDEGNGKGDGADGESNPDDVEGDASGDEPKKDPE